MLQFDLSRRLSPRARRILMWMPLWDVVSLLMVFVGSMSVRGTPLSVALFDGLSGWRDSRLIGLFMVPLCGSILVAMWSTFHGVRRAVLMGLIALRAGLWLTSILLIVENTGALEAGFPVVGIHVLWYFLPICAYLWAYRSVVPETSCSEDEPKHLSTEVDLSPVSLSLREYLWWWTPTFWELGLAGLFTVVWCGFVWCGCVEQSFLIGGDHGCWFPNVWIRHYWSLVYFLAFLEIVPLLFARYRPRFLMTLLIVIRATTGVMMWMSFLTQGYVFSSKIGDTSVGVGFITVAVYFGIFCVVPLLCYWRAWGVMTQSIRNSVTWNPCSPKSTSGMEYSHARR